MTTGENPTVEHLYTAAGAIARRIHPTLTTSVLDPDDLRQEALAAALEARKNSTTPRTMPYYTRVMENRIFDVLRIFDPLSQSARRGIRALNEAESRLMQERGATNIPLHAVAERAGIAPQRARALIRLEHESKRARQELKETVAVSPATGGEDAVLAAETRAAFNNAFQSLEERDQAMIRLTLFSDGRASYTTIGKALGVSRQRARTLSQRAVKRLYAAYIVHAGYDTTTI